MQIGEIIEIGERQPTIVPRVPETPARRPREPEPQRPAPIRREKEKVPA